MYSIIEFLFHKFPFGRRRNNNDFLARINKFLPVTIEEPGADDVFNSIKQHTAVSEFHRYTCVNFEFNARASKLVQPKIAAQGNPWLWRARFWDYQP